MKQKFCLDKTIPLLLTEGNKGQVIPHSNGGGNQGLHFPLTMDQETTSMGPRLYLNKIWCHSFDRDDMAIFSNFSLFFFFQIPDSDVGPVAKV